jgi:hypothetical protein
MIKDQNVDLNEYLKKEKFFFNNLDTISNLIDDKDSTDNQFFSPPNILNLFTKIIKIKKFNIINFVIPCGEDLALLSAIFTSLDQIKDKYKDLLINYTKILKEGTNVELCQSKKVYKFMGQSKINEKFIRIDTIPFGKYGKAKIEKKVNDIFQFFPTTKKITNFNVGKSDWKKPLTSELDKILRIKTYNNPLLMNNNIILLTSKKEKVENFFKFQHLNGIKCEKIFTYEHIDVDGNIESEYEPNILYASNLNNIYEYIKKKPKERIIICDNISKIKSSTLINQIKEINNNIKFVIFSEESDFDMINELNKKINHHVWKFEKSEIREWFDLDNKDIDISKLNKNLIYSNFEHDTATRIKVILKNTIDQKIDFTDFPEDDFDSLTKILKRLYKFKSESSEEIHDIISDTYIIKHKLQDCLFGPKDEILEALNKTKKNISFFIDNNKNLLNHEEYDYLIKINNIVSKINLNDENFLAVRKEELINKFKSQYTVYNRINTTIISDNPKIQIYYKKNLRDKYDLDIDINTTLTPKKVYKYAIVPSELNQSRISNLINEHKYKNINFFTTPSIKEKINKIIAYDKFKWKKFFLNDEEKAKLCSLESDKKNLFHFSEHVHYSIDILKDIGKKTDWDEILSKPFDISKKIVNSTDPEAVETNVIIFYGESYGCFTEGVDFRVVNNLFNNSKSAEHSMKTVEMKNLKVDDYILLRDSSDRDVVEIEASQMLKNKDEYLVSKDKATKWQKVLVNCLDADKNLNANNLFVQMVKLGYDKSKATLRNLINNLVICPDDIDDLIILFKSIEQLLKKEIISEKNIQDIYKNAVNIKTLHRKAGRLMSKKILLALKEQDVDVGREPARVDYNIDGSISINSNESDKPEAWIVQVKSFEKEKKFIAKSDVNKLQF